MKAFGAISGFILVVVGITFAFAGTLALSIIFGIGGVLLVVLALSYRGGVTGRSAAGGSTGGWFGGSWFGGGDGGGWFGGDGGGGDGGGGSSCGGGGGGCGGGGGG